MEGYIGEIRLFAGNFSPRSWAYCNGGLIAISANSALFSILGTTYGGDGRTTFGLPDLIGRTAIGAGQGAGLSPYPLGARIGSNTRTLLYSNLPQHTHSATATVAAPAFSEEGNSGSPTGATLASKPNMYSNESPDTTLKSFTHPGGFSTGVAGSSYPLNITQPLQGSNYIICMYGLYPSRN